jgi:hypothetical protein
MTRPKLSLARRAPAVKRPPLSLVKKALRLFKSKDVPKEVYRKNAEKWLASVYALGDRALLKGGEPRWGRPGQPYEDQVHAPRRMQGSAK